MRRMRRPNYIAAALLAGVALAVPASAAAHVHVVTGGNHAQQLANGQNHAPFVLANGLYSSCGQVDPAGYGLETAHHGPDQGTPGKSDGCFALATPPAQTDRNPAID
jgi:hypothetical protein